MDVPGIVVDALCLVAVCETGTELQAKPEHLRVQPPLRVGAVRDDVTTASTVSKVAEVNNRRCATKGPITEEEITLAKTLGNTELGRALLPELQVSSGLYTSTVIS